MVVGLLSAWSITQFLVADCLAQTTGNHLLPDDYEKGPVRMSCSNPFRNPALPLVLVILCAADVHAQDPYVQGAYAQGPYEFCQPQQNCGYQPQQIDRYVGEHHPAVWDDSQPIERFLTAVAKRSQLSIEYLHWNLNTLPDGNLGAPILDVADPTTPFQVFDNLNGGASAGLAVVPQAQSLVLDDVSGVRGTLGVAMNEWTLEGTFFGTEQSDSDLQVFNLQASRVAGTEAIGTVFRPNIVTPLLTNGAASSRTAMNAFVYDNSYQTTLDSQLWGAEILMLKEFYLPQEAFNWQWLSGFRYVNFDEEFASVGTFNNGGALAVNRVTRIGGSSVNNVYGPQVGGRASIRSKHVVLSATPRIAFALNDHTSTVATGPLTAVGEPVTRLTQESIDFTPIVEVNLKTQINLTPNFSVFAGYDFFWMFQTSRPSENIVYDSVPGPGGAFTPNIGQNVSLTDFSAHGLNVGGQFTY